ncbi:hypothetical protein [Methanimicrococcus blatticola]|uniref:Uncharacterized protein n=1 Tax=Methanimicrococcus blatticola TaxID=91560 RepID=A0A484F507_9EURY|nr:hypothetical protein [Methanimicrococcus blatticola]MBZ3935919.1 hypothetical protein [Methanimicrococcus blatticola]MCC2509468.1 hypothetical protein [Methanimicrococcus blatticola]TDQ68345.1 hypothetical protein C7391_1289 [Methanimicrococcus blatticola]
MVKTIQRKITSAYSLWLFVVFIAMIAYFLLIGNVFETYEDAMPWILGYIALAIVGNIGMLIAMYKFLVPNRDGLKFVAVYEIIFVIIMILSYLIMYMQWIPENGYGNLNFPTLLNAVLPFMFIFLILAEFILSKALRLMPIKAV